MRNQFLGFANQIIAQHTQGGGPFDSVAMIFPEAAEQDAGETVQNSYVTNLYRIQRITEENHLYQQNFQLLNQLYEKQVFRNLYPTVEKQVEKLISRELPEAEEKLAWLQSLAVTGKRSALKPEGGETTYLLVTPEGAEAEFVFSDSLLARPDGMYTVEALSTEELEKLEDLKNAQDAIDRTREGIKKRTE